MSSPVWFFMLSSIGSRALSPTSFIPVLLLGVVLSPSVVMGQQTAGTPVAPTAHPQVESIKSMRSQTVATDTKRKSKYTIKVDGKSWVDTGVSVNAGDQMTFSADGNMQSVDGRKFAPDGVDRGWKDMLRQFPLDSAKAGSLLGRISDNPGAVPFLIGGASKLVAPQSGHLFVRANLPDDLAPTGEY